jgi:NADH dehydrogenase/NADH:ubiquinone oxidoreductase subunit G
MIEITIDGKKIWANEGSTILEAARLTGIYIPTLCYHEALTPYGACRLCSVEITTAAGRTRLVASCLYPAEDGLQVKTNSERVQRLRKGIMELLLARCPNSDKIKDLARQMGVTEPSFILEDEECILCGLCVRVCDEISEKKLLSFVNRGTKREVAAAFYEPPEECIKCGGCAYVCPTGAIKIEDGKPVFPWMKKAEALKG